MSIKKARRNTRQRQLIQQIVLGVRVHPTAEWVYAEARKQMPRISRGTVYRNLGVLLAEGRISELKLNGAVTRYEIKRLPHYHFRCEQCGQVFDLKQPVNKGLDDALEKETGLKVISHQIIFNGICRECQLKNFND